MTECVKTGNFEVTCTIAKSDSTAIRNPVLRWHSKSVLVFVDVEAFGGCPATGQMTEFGAVDFRTRQTFHGLIVDSRPSQENPAIPVPTGRPSQEHEYKVASEFAYWLGTLSSGRLIFVSDNPAYDFQWINDLFFRTLGENPFGHSARRIGDFYAGLVGDFYAKQNWKRLRITHHDHNPVHDSQGNAEAFQRLLNGEL